MNPPGTPLNHLLAALWQTEKEALIAHLELVPMRLGEVVQERGERLRHAYFPSTCIVSLQYLTESGAACETSGVGREGMVGVSLFLGGMTMPGSAVVRTAGEAYRLPEEILLKEFERGGGMQRALLRYTQALIAQTTQTAICNRHHSIDQALCRWLLSTLDRLTSGELVMTQELIAGMLGVRREGITDAAGKLQAAGLIRNRRGHISVLDRRGLQAHACECYGVVKLEMGRLLDDVLNPVASSGART